MQMQSKSSEVIFESNLALLAKQVVEGFITGLHKSPFHGFSVEFAEHRLYNVGDNVKNIDWKLFAKTDKLYNKRYEEETNLRCQFVIDVSSSMYFPEDSADNKLSFAVQSAAALVYLLKKQRDAFGLSLFAEDLRLNIPAKSSTVHQKIIFNELTSLINNPKKNIVTNLSNALHQVAELVHQRSLIIIFSDMLQALGSEEEMTAAFHALQHLKYRKHEVIVYKVVDKNKEQLFEYENRPYEFIDLETGKVLKANAAAVKENYLQQRREFDQKLALQCAQYKIDLVDADINLGYKQVLEAYLIKRQRMM